MKNLIKVDGKAYAKSLVFGNQKAQVVFRNRKKYDRKKEKHSYQD